MSSRAFFNESLEQSEVKARIVQKYFWAWAKIVLPRAQTGRIGYIDLFAGPGRYQDGTASTPLLILEKAIAEERMSEALVSIFNDKDERNSRSLEDAIKGLPGIERLRHPPQVNTGEVGEEIVKEFETMALIPSLIFVDPWGYKGLSLRLVNSVLKDWACECVFFFNYNRINAGLSNPFVVEHMNALFGPRADALRAKLGPLSPADRELTIVEELTAALKDFGGKYVLPFTFKNESGTRTSHHLFFVSKHPLGYGIMKEIMAKESTSSNQGVPTFMYNPADTRFPLLFELSRPLDELAKVLLRDFAGKTMTVPAVFQRHNVGRPFIRENYREIIRRLEVTGQVKCDPPAAERRKRKGQVTLADHVKVTFPKG